MLALMNRKVYKLYDLSKDKWIPIAAARGNSAVTVFVDGGNASLVSTPTAELQRLRTAAVAVAAGRIASVRQNEGDIIVRVAVDGEKVAYATELFDSGLELSQESKSLAFEKSEIAISEGSNATAAGKAAEAVRRLAEIAAAKAAVKELADRHGWHYGGRKIVIVDGALETFSEKESRAMNDLAAAAKGTDVILGSVAKTCALLTDTGESLIAAAERLAEGKEGYIIVAEGLNERHRAAVAVAKLNTSAGYLFRVEAANGSELGELVAALAMQSNDLAFPGYPYGLIMADRFARISGNDAEITKSKIAATANAEVKALLKDEKALNAHSILDGKSYYKWL
ncbi:hypothetical protein HYV85_02495 [Candidatus Woesearchaeota archaeon]|nr:hypothetical protein [Candidatus Woesearchaeota archaeon]